MKIGKQRKKEVQIKVKDAILDNLAIEKSSGNSMPMRIAERKDYTAMPGLTIHVLMIVEEKSGTEKWKRIGIGRINCGQVKGKAEAEFYDFEDGDNTVAHKTVPRRPVLEQSTVIPPSLVGTIKFQHLIVFLELHLDPYAVRIALHGTW